MVVYIKMTSGEDLVASVDALPINADEDIEIRQPFALKIQKEHGFYEYSAYRWDMFLHNKGDSVYWFRQKDIMLFGEASESLVKMYVEWTSEQAYADDEEEEDDDYTEEEVEQIRKDYYKRMH